ncbi:MAG: indole-3-glycerol phosphate synthase TrpC [Anaerolineae bacterium]|nr:indole-3-glycerol phosphate synthase TrpC [Thermoflexales bacterium]MDW8408290.1 indole-3-glycerol phosphate synthase TrpC [Anaerolineae bacterium]
MSESILGRILEHKRLVELPERRGAAPLAIVRRAAEQTPQPRDFTSALRRADDYVALIAEIKRASPSRGELVKGPFDPLDLARLYEANGASAISVLTDETFFKGTLEHLAAVKRETHVPVLRKDFIIDPYQIYEARAAGADAVLLIVAALDDAQLRDLHALATELSLTALVEVHDEAEVERALRAGARVIGVNNRDLRTFVTDIETTQHCARVLFDKAGPKALADPLPMLVSESGIFTPQDVARVAGYGASAVLVGESLITSGDIPAHTRALAGVPRMAASVR